MAKGYCGSGLIPANGLVYAMPNHCNCYPMVREYAGYGPAPAGTWSKDSNRLQKGPAFGTGLKRLDAKAAALEWSTFRSDGGRATMPSSAVCG